MTEQASTGFAHILKSNKDEISSIESLRDRVETATPRNILFAIMIAGLGFLCIMFAGEIITGMFAAILTGVTVVGGYFGAVTLKNFDPYFRQKLKNEKLKVMMNEARKNAIYQLDNQVLDNTQKLGRARKSRDNIGGMVNRLEAKIDKADADSSNYKKMKKMYDKVNNAYVQMDAGLKLAAKANKAFEKKVVEYKEMESFAQMAIDAMDMLGSAGGSDLNDLLSLAAFDEIESNFSTALAAIENSAADMAIDNEE